MEIPKVEIIKNIGCSLLGFKIIKTEIDKSVQTDYFIILTPFQFQLTFASNNIGIHIKFLKFKVMVSFQYG